MLIHMYKHYNSQINTLTNVLTHKELSTIEKLTSLNILTQCHKIAARCRNKTSFNRQNYTVSQKCSHL